MSDTHENKAQRQKTGFYLHQSSMTYRRSLHSIHRLVTESNLEGIQEAAVRPKRQWKITSIIEK